MRISNLHNSSRSWDPFRCLTTLPDLRRSKAVMGQIPADPALIEEPTTLRETNDIGQSRTDQR